MVDDLTGEVFEKDKIFASLINPDRNLSNSELLYNNLLNIGALAEEIHDMVETLIGSQRVTFNDVGAVDWERMQVDLEEAVDDMAELLMERDQFDPNSPDDAYADDDEDDEEVKTLSVVSDDDDLVLSDEVTEPEEVRAAVGMVRRR